jgi:hypothetical protein
MARMMLPNPSTFAVNPNTIQPYFQKVSSFAIKEQTAHAELPDILCLAQGCWVPLLDQPFNGYIKNELVDLRRLVKDEPYTER